MAYESVYESIGWQNNQSPDINEENLGRMDYALSEIDKRVVEMDARTDEKIEELDVKTNEKIEELDVKTNEKIEEAVSVVGNYNADAKKYAEQSEESAKRSSSSASSSQSYSIASNNYAKQAESVVGTVNGYKEQAKQYRDEAETYAKNASAVTGVNIATKGVAGIIKGGDNLVGEDGTLMLTKTTTERTLYESNPGGLKVNSIEGESQQTQYSGKNLYDEVSLNHAFSYSGITATKKSTGQLSFSGTSTASINEIMGSFTLPAGTYYMSSGTHSGVAVRLYNNTSSSFVLSNNGSFTLETESVLDIRIQTTSGAVASGTVQIQIEVGSTATDYEPYVGGTASPNPDYPQDIESVKVGEVWTVGKNLREFTGGTMTAGATETYKFMSRTIADVIKPNTTYTASFYTDWKSDITVAVYNSAANVSGAIERNAKAVNGRVSLIFTTKDDLTNFNKLLIYAGVAGATGGNTVSVWDIQLEEGSLTDYEPYTEKKITLSNPITLRGIGDVKDSIVKQDGVYGTSRKQGYALFDGSDDEAWVSASAVIEGEVYYRYKISLENANANTSRSSCLCNRAIYNKLTNTIGSCFIYGSQLFICAEHKTLEDFKTWIVSNNVTVQYPLATSTFEPLPTADQIALHQLETFDTATYLHTDSTIEPVIEVEYGTSVVGAYALKGINATEAEKLTVPVNNLLATVPGSSLDAAQGKVLSDLISLLQNDFNDGVGVVVTNGRTDIVYSTIELDGGIGESNGQSLKQAFEQSNSNIVNVLNNIIRRLSALENK